MNTNNLKRFARQARKKLLEQTAARLEMVLHTDSAELREKAAALHQLQKAINQTGKEQVVEKVAYTWFNRLMALRFMDANDYQPIGMRVVTPKEGFTLPEILDEAKQGNIPGELPVKHQHIYDLLDGKIPAANPQNEAYKELLTGACNHLNKVFPFLFERINDYTELLLPDDLTSEFSIVHDIREGMTAEECREVEIIGWLYQFYISEKNEELISSKKKYTKNDLAPASQLFTPKWIVKYMVDNTLGQLWTELNPDTSVINSLEFYIKPAYKDQLQDREQKSIEDIKLFDPCVGSGHILAYAFDVFYKMYEEQGYNPSEIPELIITKNLYGADIDQRAAQLASFVLLMKGRQKHRRFLRAVERKNIQPNINFYQDFDFDDKFSNATALGSLIKVERHEVESLEVEETSLFGEQQKELKKLYQLLGQRYDVVVTNPPYISSSRMEGSLKQYVEKHYPETKSDLFATFVLRNLELCNANGLTGYMTPFVWMFISSYEKLRNIIIDKHFINNLIQLEYSGFDGATVPICTFTLRNKPVENAKGSYIRLSDFKGAKLQAPKTLEAIQNPDCGWFYTANQKDFKKIPGSPIGYWANDSLLDAFLNEHQLKTVLDVRQGMSTTNNERFVRYWSETNLITIGFGIEERNKAVQSKLKWFPFNKGGKYRKWFGNNHYIVNFQNDGFEIKSEVKRKYIYLKGNTDFVVKNQQFYFKEGLTWSAISSGDFSLRFFDKGFIIADKGQGMFGSIDRYNYLVALLNSKITKSILKILSPTLDFNSGYISKIPIKQGDVNNVYANENIAIARFEWNSRETSWDFKRNGLVEAVGSGQSEVDSGEWIVDSGELGVESVKKPPTTHSLPTTHYPLPTIEQAYQAYTRYWQEQFYQLHHNEEELNARFIEIYGLQEELTPDVPLADITILRDELDQKKLKEISDSYRSGWRLVDGEKWVVDSDQWIVDGGQSAVGSDQPETGGSQSPITTHHSPITTHQPPTTNKPDLPFNKKEIIKQFISYAVGCMFGRYSLDKPGLILANQGETVEDYFEKVGSGQWGVDSVQWGVDSGERTVDSESSDSNKIYENESSKLQSADRLAKSDETGRTGLSGKQGVSEGGGFRADITNTPGGSEHTQQYSRGTGTQIDKGIHSILIHCPRFKSGSGDANPDCPAIKLCNRRYHAANSGNVPRSGQNDLRTFKQSETNPLTGNSPLPTPHSPLFTTDCPLSTVHYLPDDDNIIPVLDDDWFEDDITGRFKEFLKASFGTENYEANLRFIEDALGKDIRKYFIKDFYADHIKRYKKRPIYWMFSSPKGSFNVLIYMHRYTPDTLNLILNNYLREYREKLNVNLENIEHILITGTPAEQAKASRQKDRLKAILNELQEYERDILYPMAAERISIDLDDGVLVNYNKFGKAIKQVAGLNDPKTKKKVKGFDWIDNTQIR